MKQLIKRVIGDTNPLRLWYHRMRSGQAAKRAGYPASRLRVIAVTGTDGKTTTVAMIAHILHACGKTVGAASTAFFQVNDKREPNPTQKTSVSAATLQSFLNRLVRERCEFAVIEASSHGLMQGRLAGIQPEVAAVTNVTMEHLDYHGTMKEYIRAKGLLFASMNGEGTKVLNIDDVSFPVFEQIPSARFSPYSPSHDINIVKADAVSSQATVLFGGDSFVLSLPIPGTFNLNNALCAMHCVAAVGIAPQDAVKALSTFSGTAGRMERVDGGQPFTVFVDFTVTPIAYESTLMSARRLVAPNGRLLVLSGSCGDRMREKRPVVGSICAKLADIVAVSNEDPYTEDPESIIDEVLAGVPRDFPLFRGVEAVALKRPSRFCVRISNRLEAIRFLLREAKEGDVVLLCGKGADVTMMTATGQIPWNEREITLNELRSLQTRA